MRTASCRSPRVRGSGNFFIERERRITVKAIASSKKSLVKAIVALVLAIAVFLTAILGGGSVVFGWFATGENNIGVGGLSSSVESGTIGATYSVYAYDDRFERASTYYLDNEGAAGDPIAISAISLSAYDRTFTMRNHHTPVIIRIQISDAQIPQNGTISIRIKRNPNMLGDATGQTSLNRRSSSVTRYALIADPALITAAAATNDPDTALYNAINETYYSAMQAATMGQRFVTKNTQNNPATYEKAAQITIPLSYTSSMWNGSTLNLYLYITYDAPMLAEYLEENITVGGNNSGDDRMENDLATLELIIGGA